MPSLERQINVVEVVVITLASTLLLLIALPRMAFALDTVPTGAEATEETIENGAKTSDAILPDIQDDAPSSTDEEEASGEQSEEEPTSEDSDETTNDVQADDDQESPDEEKTADTASVQPKLMGVMRTGSASTSVGLNGIDISSWNPDFATSGFTNYDFAIVKATQSTNYTNPYMTGQANKVLKDGKLLGFYHYLGTKGNETAEGEATFFANAVSDYIGKAVLALDWEDSGMSKGVGYAKAFLDTVYGLTGVMPLIYMSESVVTGSDWSSVVNAGYKLWEAKYFYKYYNSWLSSHQTEATSWYGYTHFSGYAGNPTKGNAGEWGSPTIYQYTPEGDVGYMANQLDIDKFYGSKADWIALATPTASGYESKYVDVYDYQYYHDTYADLAKAFGTNRYQLVLHFINFGMKEGRQASASFDPVSYRLAHRDLRVAFGGNWKSYFEHYVNFGKKEGRTATGVTTLQQAVTKSGGIDYSPVYSYTFYYNTYQDLRNAFGKYDDDAMLAHFLSFGIKEGRQASASFDPSSYRLAYRDLRAAFRNNWRSYYLHYLDYGKREGRKAVGTTSMKDAVTVYNGVDYASVYDYATYYATYSDLQKAFGRFDDDAMLAHFVTFGMREGRTASPGFNVYAYKARYADLQRAFGNDLAAYYRHYVTYGVYEGRIASAA